MTRYLLLNCLVLSVPLLWALVRRRHIFNKQFWLTLLALLLLTAIFDNLIIVTGIVEYNTSSILGWYVYKAPVEDFFYSIAAAILIPLLWKGDNNETTH